MIVPDTYMRLPCGKCEVWVEESLGVRTFILHAHHDDPESCPDYRWVRDESKRQGHPELVVDTR